MVALGGLEPPRLSAGDFESPVYTNFTTAPYFEKAIQQLYIQLFLYELFFKSLI